MNNFLEIAGMFIIPLVVVLVPLFIGQHYGVIQSKRLSKSEHEPIGTAVGATFGLLAFMLAFTFQMAADRFNARKELLIEEVTNIRTTYMRAGLIPEPYRSESRILLLEYIDLRADFASKDVPLEKLLSRSEEILGKLWATAEKLSEQDRSSESYALFTGSVNEIEDNYNQRVTIALEYRIPQSIFWVLFVIAFLSMMALGYQFGLSGKSNYKINILLAVVFATVMFLILILDNPLTGLANVNQKPVYTLQKQLHLKQESLGK